MTLIYVVLISLLSLISIDYYEIPLPLNYIIAPAIIFLGIPPGEIFLLSLPINTLLISLAIYAGLGYLADWFYEPYK